MQFRLDVWCHTDSFYYPRCLWGQQISSLLAVFRRSVRWEPRIEPILVVNYWGHFLSGVIVVITLTKRKDCCVAYLFLDRHPELTGGDLEEGVGAGRRKIKVLALIRICSWWFSHFHWTSFWELSRTLSKLQLFTFLNHFQFWFHLTRCQFQSDLRIVLTNWTPLSLLTCKHSFIVTVLCWLVKFINIPSILIVFVATNCSIVFFLYIFY